MRIADLWSGFAPVLALTALPVFFGCRSEGASGDGGSGGGGTAGRMDSSSGGAGGGTTGSGPAAGSSGRVSTCNVDFPCSSNIGCTADGLGYQRYVTIDCHSVCGPGPCDGAGCVAQGSPVMCPEGTRCGGNGSNSDNQPCQPIDAGVPDTGSDLSAPQADAGSDGTDAGTDVDSAPQTDAGSGSGRDAGPQPVVDASTVITLDRTVCFGVCPSYSLRIGGDGTVVYSGRQFVKVVGTASAQVPVSDVQALVNEMEQANYFNLTVPQTCARGIATDYPTATTSLTLGGATHTVEHYGGNPCAPTVLTTLEDRIDAVAQSTQWVDCGTAAGFCTN